VDLDLMAKVSLNLINLRDGDLLERFGEENGEIFWSRVTCPRLRVQLRLRDLMWIVSGIALDSSMVKNAQAERVKVVAWSSQHENFRC